MLNEGYRREAENMFAQYMLAHPQDTPEYKEFIKSLQWASKEASDILNPDDDVVTDVSQLKKVLG